MLCLILMPDIIAYVSLLPSKSPPNHEPLIANVASVSGSVRSIGSVLPSVPGPKLLPFCCRQILGVSQEEPNNEWDNPTCEDNLILGNSVKKCPSDSPIWYKVGYPLHHKLDAKEHPYTATCKCCKKGINVKSDLKEFHEEMREIHYSLNNNFKLLCSMVKPLVKAAAQLLVAKNTSKVMPLTHGSPPWNKGEQRSRGSTYIDIYFLPLQRYLPLTERSRSRLFDLTKGGEGKQRARAYRGEDKLPKLGEDQVQASPNYKAKIKTQATSTAFFIRYAPKHHIMPTHPISSLSHMSNTFEFEIQVISPTSTLPLQAKEHSLEIFFMLLAYSFPSPMKEKFNKYFKELPPMITRAAALNPVLNRTGVETLIMNIAYDLGLTEDDTSYVSRQISRFNEAFDNMFQVYLDIYGSSSSIIHSMHQEAGSSSHGSNASKKLYNLLRSENIKRARGNTLVASSEVAMARDLLSVKASTVGLESAFSVNGRVISPRRTKLTPISMEVCICLKDYLDSMEQIQYILPFEDDLEQVEEEIHAEEIAMSITEPIDEDEIANFNQHE
ncbi:zinc finger BED domain-containing protein RICESLEEPER 2-like protein [Tanacetum coccineum]